MARSIWRAAILAILAGPILSSCAQTGAIGQLMTAPVGAEDDDERAYDLGHKLGRRDAASELSPDALRHARRFDISTEPSFSKGYGDGYAGRPNRMGSPDTRDWLYDRAAERR
jgi:hypothetical protein